MLLLCLAGAAPANAAILKCTGVDGKATFSDQPCPAGQAAQTLREAPPAPASPARPAPRASPPDGAASALDALKGVLPPECGSILAKMQRQSGAELPPAEVAALSQQWAARCDAATRQSMASGDPAADARRKAEICSAARKLQGQTRSQTAGVDPASKAALQEVEQQIAQACR